jgi:hypothetical protein
MAVVWQQRKVKGSVQLIIARQAFFCDSPLFSMNLLSSPPKNYLRAFELLSGGHLYMYRLPKFFLKNILLAPKSDFNTIFLNPVEIVLDNNVKRDKRSKYH